MYFLRWQTGFIVALPTIWFFQIYLGWPLWAAIFGFQTVGACIYYFVDNKIFKRK